MNETERVLDQLKNLGVTTDVFGEQIESSKTQSSTAKGDCDQPMQPELFAQDSTAKEEKSEYKKGLDFAIRILSLRDYSIYKMGQKLKDRGIPNEDAEKIIQQLLKWEYLREEEYTRQRIKQLILKGYANSFIIRKLAQEKLRCKDTDIEELRMDQHLASDSIIDQLIEKKLRNKEIPKDFEPKNKFKNKVLRFLLSKGFRYSDVSSKLEQRFRRTD